MDITETEIREQHVQWCKKRALAYCDIGDTQQAFASMCSDLNKHDATRNHPAQQIGLMMMISGKLSSAHEMRKFIEGFH